MAWKGAVDADEDADGLAAAGALGLEREAVRAVEPYAGSERRTLHVFRKVAPTPPATPAGRAWPPSARSGAASMSAQFARRGARSAALHR